MGSRLGRTHAALAASQPPPDAQGQGRGDLKICQGLVGGEAWAAEALYDRVAETVATVLYRLLGADADRDDLCQLVLERVITSVVSGRYARACSLRSWAALLAQNVAVDALRARKRERRLFDRRSHAREEIERVAAVAQSPEQSVETRRRMELLQSALANVKRDRAEAVVLHDVLGHDLAEIAALKGLSVAAAQSRLVRGRRDVLAWIRARDKRAEQRGPSRDRGLGNGEVGGA